MISRQFVEFYADTWIFLWIDCLETDFHKCPSHTVKVYKFASLLVSHFLQIIALNHKYKPTRNTTKYRWSDKRTGKRSYLRTSKHAKFIFKIVNTRTRENSNFTVKIVSVLAWKHHCMALSVTLPYFPEILFHNI